MPVEHIFLVIPALLFSIVLHEYAHGYAAFLAGDDTANAYGRLTLNPIAHIDLFGTIIFPAFLILSGLPAFGWAKPVPVNPLNFKSSKWEVWVSAAGPGANFFLLIVSALLIKLLFITGLAQIPNVSYLIIMLVYFIIINTILGIFNLIPLPPLDGSHILFYFMRRQPGSDQVFTFLRQYGFLILIVFLMLPPTRSVFWFFIDGILRIISIIFGIPL